MAFTFSSFLHGKSLLHSNQKARPLRWKWPSLFHPVPLGPLTIRYAAVKDSFCNSLIQGRAQSSCLATISPVVRWWGNFYRLALCDLFDLYRRVSRFSDPAPSPLWPLSLPLLLAPFFLSPHSFRSSCVCLFFFFFRSFLFVVPAFFRRKRIGRRVEQKGTRKLCLWRRWTCPRVFEQLAPVRRRVNASSMLAPLQTEF